jgi:LmbE family N-acetylglucosaminyl deacetylase
MTSILVVAAHPDDEVLGCGGYISKQVNMGHKVSVLCVADGVSSRSGEVNIDELSARREGADEAGKILGIDSYVFGDFPDNQLDTVPLLKIVKFIENAISIAAPQVVLTHHHGDLNIDHSVVSRATITACRPSKESSIETLLFFETPSSTEWSIGEADSFFVPNWYEDISESMAKKVEALTAYKMELREWPHPRSIRAIKSLAEWRGATCGFGAAEAFVLGRQIS